MKKVKKYLSLSLVLLFLFVSIPVSASDNLDMGFNEYGFRNPELQKEIERELSEISLFSLASNGWEDFGKEYNIPLEKRWTVKLSRSFNYSEIAAISIVSGGRFISVNIEKGNSKELLVYPKEKFSGSTEYSLRIVLENGKRYKKDFITANEYRDADIEPNNNYKDAKEIFLNETVIGSLETREDDLDFYKIEIPRSGSLRIDGTQLDGGEIGITLYSTYGTDSSNIASDYRGQRAQVVTGLQKGTYYIGVYRRSGEGNYILENTFTESKYDNDNASDNYINAGEISINDMTTGHIGHYRSNGVKNNLDFYKISIPNSGKLRIDGTQLDGGEIGITLYSTYGTDSSSIASDYRGQRVQVITGLEKGSYYIAVHNRSGYGAYELDLNFVEQDSKNDNSPDNYIQAREIPINQPTIGHIGHYKSNGSKNNLDFHKIEIPRTGTLRINGSQLNGGEIGITLYSEYGTDSSNIATVYRGQKVQISRELTKGTYYIGVYNRSGYGAYKLDLNFD